MKRVLSVALTLVLAGCATSPTQSPAPAFDAAAAVATIRAAGAELLTELDVQPLQDPLVADLREQARSDEQAGRFDDAAAALDRALAERPDDPAVLQERAELALLKRQPDAAFDFAQRARRVGPTVGPLCRRSVETLLQVERIRAQMGDDTATARADALASERDACTVKPPPRY
ncbi:MAG TPA: tetratricopeptide repeat protein [Lysobacter sp.]